MKRYILMLAALSTLAFTAAAAADNTVPFPNGTVGGVFVSGQTVTSTGAVSDSFAPGNTVVFRAYAVDTKTHKLLTKKIATLTKTNRKDAKSAVKTFFVRIPLVMKDIQLQYKKIPKGLDGRYRWVASWKVPATYPLGVVQFEMFARTWTNRTGTFSQVPLATSQLTITLTPQEPFAPGPTTAGSVSSSNLDVVLYVDAVNGTHPAGAPPRPIGCTQTNVFEQGEQLVVRAFGYALSDGSVLSMDNVTDAHYSVPGEPDTLLNWGSHGPTGDKVWYWTGAWNIPVDYPLGDLTVHVSFTTILGKTGTVDYPVTIIPQS